MGRGGGGRESGGSAGTGSTGTGGLPTTGGGATGGPEPPPGSACASLGINPGRAPLRRLNLTEYRNTVRDLLGETGPIVDHFPPNEEGLGFSNIADEQFVSALLAQTYMTAAETLACPSIAKLYTS